MKTKKGGIKTRSDLDSFESVLETIKSATSISHISYESSAGFIFKVSGKSHFKALNMPKNIREDDYGTPIGEFNVELTTICIKFVIINNETPIRELPPLIINKTNIIKRCNYRGNLSKEAAIQQELYLKTIVDTSNPVCPEVLDLSFFNPKQAIELLKLLLAKPFADSESRPLLNYIFDQMHTHFSLGMLTMELLELPYPYKPVDDLYDYREVYDEQEVYNGYTLGIAKLIIILLNGYVHLDCISANMLSNGIDSKIIDFGLMMDVYNPKDLTNYYWEHYTKKNYTADLTHILKMKKFTLNDVNICIRFIACLSTRKVTYDGNDHIIPQLNYVLKYLYNDMPEDWLNDMQEDWLNRKFIIAPNRQKKFQAIFDEITKKKINKPTQDEINDLIRQGALFKYDDEDSYDRRCVSTCGERTQYYVRQLMNKAGFVHGGVKKTKKIR